MDSPEATGCRLWAFRLAGALRFLPLPLGEGRGESWDTQANGTMNNGLTRLAVAVFALTALAYGLANANRLPGSGGEVIRANIEADRDATALFYTEVDGWDEWPVQR